MRRGLSASCVAEAFKTHQSSLSLSDPIKKKEKSRYEEDFLEIEKLGRGGYGSVYKVQNRLDGLFYALKKIQFKNTSSQLLEKVLREVKTLALLNHPNIVRYHSAWKEEEDALQEEQPFSPKLKILDESNEWSDSESTCSVSSENSLEQFNPLKFENSLNEDSNGLLLVGKLPHNQLIPSPPIRPRNNNNNLNNNTTITNTNNTTTNSNNTNNRKRHSISTAVTNITTLYIVMQLYTTTLAQWLESRVEMSPTQNLYIFKEICKGLQYIHSRGVIHRDLKPGNIFLSRSDENSHLGGEFAVCLGDFGLAIHNGTPPSPTHSPFFPAPSPLSCSSTPSLTSSSSDISMPSSYPSPNISDSPMSVIASATSSLARSWEAKKHTSAVGTLTYSSPEQRYKGVYNEKTDIYSLGIIFFELYYTSSTKMERARVLADLRNRIIPSDFLKRYPAESAFILRLMSPNPDDRPSVDEILRHDLLVDEFTTVPRKDIVEMEMTLQQQRELLTQQQAYIQLLEQKLSSLEQALSQKDKADAKPGQVVML